MYKNQLQELAQRSCFSLPSYTCTREGPDHAPRFKASVNFNGERFECPTYCSTLRQAEHAAAEVALNALSSKGPSKSLTARVLDETGIYKNLLQETAHRAGLDLPIYKSVRSGPGHIPTFTCIVELAGMCFNGEPAKTKKQAEKNAAIAAWFSLKKMQSLDSHGEKEQEVVARVLSRVRPKEVRRREPTQSRRRTFIRSLRQETTTRDLLCENLRLINLLTNEEPSSSSSQKHHQSSFISLISRTNLQQQSNGKSLLEKTQEYARKQWLNDAKPGMITKSFHLPTNESSTFESKLLHFSNNGRYMFTGGFNINHQKLAPAVHIRSVIPVCAAPPLPPPQLPSKPNPNNPSISSLSNQSTTTSLNLSSAPRALLMEISREVSDTRDDQIGIKNQNLGQTGKSDDTHD